MITENEIMEIISDYLYDDDRTLSDKLKAAEFIMKYHYGKISATEEGGERVLIIDDIRTKN